MTEETPLEATESDELPVGEVTTPDETADDGSDDVISLEAARKLRSENKSLRDRAKDAEARAEGYAQRLHAELVNATGRLVNPDELPFTEDHLTDPDALEAGIDALLLGKPYLANKSPRGDIGMGRSTEATGPQDFSALFR